MRLDVLNNVGTPFQQADLLYFAADGAIGGMRVLEGPAGRIEVWGYFGSLNLFSFGLVVSAPGSAFFYGSLERELPSEFGPTAIGDGTLPPARPVGAITPGQSVVPEPSVVLLLASGLLTLGGLAARRSNAGA